MDGKQGFEMQIREYLDMTERRLWDDKRYFAWFEKRFGFRVAL